MMTENELDNRIIEANNYFIHGYNKNALKIIEQISDNSDALENVMVFDTLIKDLQALILNDNKVNVGQLRNRIRGDFGEVTTFFCISKRALSQD